MSGLATPTVTTPIHWGCRRAALCGGENLSTSIASAHLLKSTVRGESRGQMGDTESHKGANILPAWDGPRGRLTTRSRLAASRVGCTYRNSYLPIGTVWAGHHRMVRVSA
jgi:hypothetical protein